MKGVTLLLGCLVASVGQAAEILPPVSERFAGDDIPETPDFQRHVSPLLGRLGCNGRACHGSFQGQGGFRLSLFGYDFAADHRAIEQRLNRQQPDQSLLLQKPTLTIDHDGGERFVAGSWQHRLLRRWIASGAKSATVRRLERLQIEPASMVKQQPGTETATRVIAHWEDGTAEDVTCLCRFETRDESIATVDSNGRVKTVGRGDTHLIASYDNAVVTLPVLIPFNDRHVGNFPQVAAPTKVDEVVLSKLRELGVVPSEVCSDEDFLRRLSIDMTGTLPTLDEIEQFLADRSPDKRRKKIDELLESPAYAAWWANRLCDITGNNPFQQSEGRVGQQQAEQWYAWMYRRVADNVPYDELAQGIVLATSRPNGERYEDYAREMSSYLRDGQFEDRDSLPHYWTRRNVEKPEDKALAFAHSFLGVRLQCAQCHKHPYDRWTKNDFEQFARFFAALEYGVAPESKAEFDRLVNSTGQPKNGNQRGQVTQEAAALAAEGRTIAWRELYVNPGRAPSGSLNLLGEQVQVLKGEDPRKPVMEWLTKEDNPYFARAFVNRVWSNYFHTGLIDPVDDLNLANPPSNGPLLDYLAAGFVSSGYDMKWLHREIASSETYQRSWKPNATNRDDKRNFSRAIPRRLPAEVVYDALKQATAAEADLVRVRENLDRRAIGHLATRMAGTYAQRVFGQPERLLACDCERNNSSTLLQSIFLQNDPLMLDRLKNSEWIKNVASAQSLDREKCIREAYLRTVSRPPDAKESQRALAYFQNSATTRAGLEDLMWALLNSKEFLLNH